MDKFNFEKSKKSNIIKSIRFPEQLNTEIQEAVEQANSKANSTSAYSFNGFVVSACEFALANMDKNK